jgi:hypothetical protein
VEASITARHCFGRATALNAFLRTREAGAILTVALTRRVGAFDFSLMYRHHLPLSAWEYKHFEQIKAEVVPEEERDEVRQMATDNGC